ncbi:MAG: DUF4230 domain-containing protein [Elusimicrobia bacterium]|nr:DUF4230 domain-containing protein [Elusimicrobiota bacterium]
MVKKISFIFIVLILIFLCILFFIFRDVKTFVKETKDYLTIHTEPKVKIEHLNNQIKNIGYLITSELQYSGVVEYETNCENNPLYKLFISKKFLMLYDAEINAGIDLSDIELIEVKNNDTESKIIVNIPKATIKSCIVNPRKFYDLKKSWIEYGETDKEAMNSARLLATEDAKNNINFDKLLSNAQKQAEIIVGNLIETGMINTKYDIEFKISDNEKKEISEQINSAIELKTTIE